MSERLEDDAPPGKRISDVGDEEHLAVCMKRHMLAKLAKNRGKLHWLEPEVTDRYLIGRLVDEVEELIESAGADAWEEAADVANFAAMLADRKAGGER